MNTRKNKLYEMMIPIWSNEKFKNDQNSFCFYNFGLFEFLPQKFQEEKDYTYPDFEYEQYNIQGHVIAINYGHPEEWYSTLNIGFNEDDSIAGLFINIPRFNKSPIKISDIVKDFFLDYKIIEILKKREGFNYDFEYFHHIDEPRDEILESFIPNNDLRNWLPKIYPDILMLRPENQAWNSDKINPNWSENSRKIYDFLKKYDLVKHENLIESNYGYPHSFFKIVKSVNKELTNEQLYFCQFYSYSSYALIILSPNDAEIFLRLGIIAEEGFEISNVVFEKNMELSNLIQF